MCDILIVFGLIKQTSGKIIETRVALRVENNMCGVTRNGTIEPIDSLLEIDERIVVIYFRA